MRPGGLSARELDEVASEAAGALAGTRLHRLRSAGRDLLLVFRRRGAKVSLLLSAAPGLARAHLVVGRWAPSGAPAPCAARMRRVLEGSRLEAIRRLREDRILELEFSRPGAAAPEPARAFLVHEVFGRKPNIALLDGERRIIALLEPIRRAGTLLAPGAPYVLPAPAAPSGRELESDLPPAEGPYPVSAAIEERSEALARERDLSERQGSLLRGLARELSRRKRTLERIDRELEAAEGAGREREIGELLKGAYGSLRRGLERIEVVDYFSEDLRKVVIPLDPKRTPEENIAERFRRYRKGRRTLEVLGTRRQEIEDEVRRLEEQEAAAAGAKDLGELARAEEKAVPLIRVTGGAPSRAKEGAGPASGPRRFLSADGCEILVGRSARENDRLTFRLARGRDIFFHVAGRTGAHVIVRPRAGGSLPPETLEDAAQLALYYSLRHRSSGAIAEGARGDVDYTAVKHVRKPKGAAPGAVLLATHKTRRVALDPARLDRLRRTRPPND